MDDFGVFWQRFPLKVGKLAAIKAYIKARRIATAEDILNGIDTYIANKPDYADWCQPTTFLNQGRWMDEHPGVVVKQRWSWADCPHVLKCGSETLCEIQSRLERGRKTG